MAKGIYPRKKVVAKIIKENKPKKNIETGTKPAMKRIAENNHTVEDTLSIGEKITAFRQSEYWIILEECIDSVIKDAVREGKKLNKSSDEILGEQAGALKVKDLIIGLDKSATIMNNQMAAQRKVESEEENGEDIKDHEDITPTASNRVGI